ncbi:HAD family hydrolase [Aureibacillus halotolerans]|uniref:Putative hydrolase of the HAD superfamily n=1 Tax=Aureibacillus halotolerans TaxID=1508390 RepID=A0A4R6U832_9BACI|nr:HAD family hydrolase [Aureibacillus halotolerans]TDQ40755.1 putative hydrolase of the HAD superfamily [Aureibacillus halotolerans]
MVQAIFFDLFQTLVTEWDGGRKRTSYSVEELGLEPAVYRQAWRERQEQRMDGTFSSHQDVLRDILKAYGKDVDGGVIDLIHQRRVDAKALVFDDIDERLLKTLKQVKAQKIKLGVISNCSPEEVEGWASNPFAQLFDNAVFSCDVKQAKPDKSIYLTACRNLNVRPHTSLFIGDGGSNELQGASDAGLTPYQATWFLPPEHQGNHGFPKLNEPSEIMALV